MRLQELHWLHPVAITRLRHIHKRPQCHQMHDDHGGGQATASHEVRRGHDRAAVCSIAAIYADARCTSMPMELLQRVRQHTDVNDALHDVVDVERRQVRYVAAAQTSGFAPWRTAQDRPDAVLQENVRAPGRVSRAHQPHTLVNERQRRVGVVRVPHRPKGWLARHLPVVLQVRQPRARRHAMLEEPLRARVCGKVVRFCRRLLHCRHCLRLRQIQHHTASWSWHFFAATAITRPKAKKNNSNGGAGAPIQN